MHRSTTYNSGFCFVLLPSRAVDGQLLHLFQNRLDLLVERAIGVVIPDVVGEVPAVASAPVSKPRRGVASTDA